MGERHEGRAERALCGGSDSLVNPLALGGFQMLGALALGEAGCRPFDRDRSGTVLGEGSAALVLESWEAARARGAITLGSGSISRCSCPAKSSVTAACSSAGSNAPAATIAVFSAT